MIQFSEKIIQKIFKLLFNFFERYSSFFFTYHLRPKAHNNVLRENKSLDFSSYVNIGILIQGPFISDDNFTIETIKLYKKLFSSCKIVLSTWGDENLKLINEARNLNIEVVLNDKPKYAGLSNINFQIVSTSAGIKKLEDLKCTYILKSRTDQRIYSNNAINFCYESIKNFPLKNIFNQESRIVSFNLNTFKYRLYGLSDMINFGHIHDLKKYWCIELDNRNAADLVNPTTMLEFAKQRYAEVYFVTSFLRNIKREIKWTLEDSWQVISEHFIVLDTSAIDLLWKKYTHKEYRHEDYHSLHNSQLNFSDWLLLYSSFPSKVPEHILNIDLNEI